MPVRDITMFMPQGTQPVRREAILAQSIAAAQWDTPLFFAYSTTFESVFCQMEKLSLASRVTWGGSNKTIPHKVIELLPIEQVRVLEQTCKESIKKKTQVETQAKTGSLTGGSEEAGEGKRRTVTCTRRGSQLQVAEKRLWS